MNWEILHKYIEGICDEEELHRLGEWLKKDPANEDFFTSFVEEWSNDESLDSESDARAAWQKFKSRNMRSVSDSRTLSDLTLANKKTHLLEEKNHKRSIASWSYSIAAMVLIAISLFFVNRNTSEPVKKEKIAYQEISTTSGQRINLQLSDSTKVILNSNSILQIPEGYGRKTRTVRLEGEAYFEVKHNEKLPFTVISNKAYAKDLGTKFNVSAYDSSGIEVAVKEGLVSLGRVENDNPKEELVKLHPNKVGILKNIGGLRVSNIKDIDKFTGWTRGKLVFRSTPFPEVVRRLERWFDVTCKIEIPNPGDRTLTATYDHMPLNEVLKVISVSMNISYKREGRTIIFRRGTD